MVHTNSRRKLTDVKLGEHICGLYETEEDHRALVVPFLRQGLERGEKIFYVLDAHDGEAILSYLRDDGISTRQPLTSGQLRILTMADVCSSDGAFSPDGMISLLQNETDRALSEGFSGLRVTSEMTWALRSLTGYEQMFEFESKMNSFLPGGKCLSLCQYDRRHFDSVVLMNVLVTHPVVVVGTDIHDNFYYMPLTDFAGPELPAGALHFWLDNLAARKRAEEVLHAALEESRQRRAETAALLECSRAVLEKQEFKDAAQSILHSCRSLVGAASGYIGLLGDAGKDKEVLLLDSPGTACRIGTSPVMPISGLRKNAYRTGRPLYANDFSKSKWAKSLPAGHLGLENVLFAPLVIKGKALGLLGLANKPGGFTENDARMALAFGELAAVALNNSRTLASLEISEERFRSVVQTASDAMIGIDAQMNVVFWNRAAETIFGHRVKDIVGKPIMSIIAEGSMSAVSDAVEKLASSPSREVLARPFDVAGMRKGGDEFPAEMSLASWRTGEGIFFTSIVRDVTKRRQQEAQLAYLAAHDPLTGLPNRRTLEEVMRRVVARARRGTHSTLMLLDVDNFKAVNDTFGHSAGDQGLISLTRILQDKLRETDLVVRLGGDEFAVVLDGTNVEGARIVAERMRQAVEEFTFNLDGVHFSMTISIGLVAIDGQHSAATVLSRVDEAMYSAKEKGRNRVVLYEQRGDDEPWLSEGNRLLSQLKEALKHGHFVLYFQPVTRLSDGQVEYYEALVRLRIKDGEVLSAGDFIPAAERHGLMPQITRWVVQKAIDTLRENPELRLSMNLSGLDLADEALPEFIEARLRDGAVAPEQLGFEITEAAVIKDLVAAERWLRRLKTLGCRFAMDDFGTGYISFARLYDLPVDQLKIDGSVIRTLETDPAQRAIVQAMQTMAMSQGKETVAECVESEITAQILKGIGITYGQGYSFGRPNPGFLRSKNGDGNNGNGAYAFSTSQLVH